MMKEKNNFWVAVIIFIIIGFFIFKGGAAIASISSSKIENQYIEVVILKGDTLWNLVEKYGNPKKDIRQQIYQIQKINDLNPTSHIQPGQILKIPSAGF